MRNFLVGNQTNVCRKMHLFRRQPKMEWTDAVWYMWIGVYQADWYFFGAIICNYEATP